jgi:predicted N-acetyltransferase YhbS
MDFRTMRPDELEAALAVAGETVSAEHVTMQARYPDLFVCCYDGEQIVGVCCGWPLRHDRTCVEGMRLHVIAFLAEYQRKGCGSRLLCEWENRVRARGNWTIDLGSGADGFYVKMGYTAFEYAVKVRKGSLPQGFRERGFEISYVRDPADPGSDEVCLYSPAGDCYQAEELAKMREVFGATSSLTVFKKRVSSSRGK